MITPVYSRQAFPTEVTGSIFLAGPTPRDKVTPSWRPEALRMLEAAGFDGHVFIPENPGEVFADSGAKFPYDDQVAWEEEGLNRADCILFWIPREMGTMPALTTNDEYGYWKSSGKVVLGAPDDAVKVRYQQHYAKHHAIPSFDTLEAACAAAASKVMPGVARRDGECQVPLLVWKTKSFQNWYAEMRKAGNRLDGARMLWNFRVGPKKDFVFAWVLHVNIYVAAEDRNKTNEFVFARTDMSAVLLYHQDPSDKSIEDFEVVVVKEFRSPVRNDAGMVVELPGGSAKDDELETRTVAVQEIEEETGFSLTADRLVEVTSRQVGATLSTHKVALYTAALTAEEMQWFHDHAGEVHGEIADTERTYPQVVTVGELMASDRADWSTIGMILTGLIHR